MKYKVLFLFLILVTVAGLAVWYVAFRDESGATDPVVSSTTPASVPVTTKPPTSVLNSKEAASGTFSAPQGAADHEGTEGPWVRRILGAYSDDGLTWTRTNEVISDQADVPSLVMDDAGTLYMYYYGWTVGTKQNVPAVATSVDDGATWAFRYLSFTGFPGRGDVSDADVLFEDGVFRMYGTTRVDGHALISYGESTDGVAFVYKGVAFQPEDADADAGVASVYRVVDGWRLLSLSTLGMPASGTERGVHWYATSSDGKSFAFHSSVLFKSDGPYFNGNVIPVVGGYRMYLFSDMQQKIRSWFSADGETWVLEDGVRLSLDVSTGLENDYVGDPDVIQLPDGRFFMAYATLIP